MQMQSFARNEADLLAIQRHFKGLLALPCPALRCPALPCPALPCPALPCPALPCLFAFQNMQTDKQAALKQYASGHPCSSKAYAHYITADR